MQTNLFFNIAAMSVMSFSYAYFIVQYESKTHTGKCFKLLMISVFAAAALDSVAVHLNETGIGVPRAVVEFIYCIYLIAVVLCAFSMVLYTRALIRKDGKRLPIDYFNNILMAVHVFMCVASPFVNIYFINTPDGHFESGPFYIVLYAFSGYYLVYVFVSMMKKYSGSSRRRFFSVIAFTVITFTGAMCQYYFFDSMVIYFIYAISVLILLFAFETPDYQKLVKTTEELEESRNLLEKARARRGAVANGQ